MKIFIWKLVNFSILVFLLYKLCANSLKRALEKKREEISNTLDSFSKRISILRKEIDEAERRLKEIDERREEVLREYRERGEMEKERLLKMAQKEGEKMKREASEMFKYELALAKEEIRKEAMVSAIEVAKGILKERIGKDQHMFILDKYLKRMEEMRQ